MLMQPTLEKLYSMKLMGMAAAIRHQMEDPESTQLSFEERLAMLVDQQWDWRQNKALTRRTGFDRMFLHAGRLRFAHPVSGEVMELVAPLPAECEALIHALAVASPPS